MADRGRNRMDQLRFQQRAGVEAAQRRLRGHGAGITGQFLLAQETACGPGQQRVEPEHRAHQQQRTIGPVVTIATVAALVLQDQVLLLCAELLVERRADHDARPPQTDQRRQPGITAGLPAAIGTRPQRAHAPLEAPLCTQLAQQADAHPQCPGHQQQTGPWQRMTARALEGARHHLQRQRRPRLPPCPPGRRRQQRHHQQGQQPPAAIGQPSAPQPHQQGPQRGQHDHAHRQPQAGLPQSFGDVLRAQLAAFAEVRHQRCHPAFEDAADEVLALCLHPRLALQQRPVKIAPAIALGGDRALGQQAVEQGLDGRLGPVAVGQCGHHLVGATRCLLPQHLHHNGFGFADRGHGLHP
ncbi:hypothetical protein G6F22_013827 [Rhizopus arrhizus]|nr:hypothetical protein G6F22_013827 [Rhizopus arrhizus]